MERFRLDRSVNHGRLACGIALCGDVEPSLPWSAGAAELGVSRYYAFVHGESKPVVGETLLAPTGRSLGLAWYSQAESASVEVEVDCYPYKA